MLKQNVKNKYVLIGLIVLLIAGSGYFVFAKRKSASIDTTNQGKASPINYDPPTAEDAQRADDNKQRIVEREEKLREQQTNTEGKRTVKPVITYAGQYGQSVEVGGYVNTFENDGTCTATFTQGSKRIAKSVTAVRGANSMDCPVMSVDTVEFNPKGTYEVVVSYSSSSATGTSDARQVEIK